MCASLPFQSTPPRGKRRARPIPRPGFNPRPPREATSGCDGADAVSIHAPAREATPYPRTAAVTAIQRVFQSTPPRGKRPGAAMSPHRIQEVSIHAPAREATSFGSQPMVAFGMSFQSTPPRGKRPGAASTPHRVPRKFQSTPPRGKRPATSGPCPRTCPCFNPRPRAGSDSRRVHPVD